MGTHDTGAVTIANLMAPLLMTKSLQDLWTQAQDAIAPNWRNFVGGRQPLIWLMALLIGVAIAYAAIGFRLLIQGFQLAWLGEMTERVAERAGTTSWVIILIAPAIGGLIVGLLLQFLALNRRPQGVADVIEAGALNGGHMPFRNGLLAALISSISLGFGASAGREGPVVHLGATLASGAGRKLGLPARSMRTLLGCGVAAAVGASFNAPLAGVLFALEVILGHYAVSAFVPIVISGVVATIVSRVHLGDFPAFVIPDYQIVSYYEFPAFALLGLACAAVAISFKAALITTDRIARTLIVPLWLRPVIGGLAVGAIAVFVPQVLGVGYGVTDLALKGHYGFLTLVALMVAKTAATSITLASRFGGGIFSPSLYMGAMAGGAFGIIAGQVFPDLASSHGLYALIGMGGVAAAVLGAPISTTLIVFELTGGFELAVALLLTVSVSAGLTQAIHGRSFFHWQLFARGLVLDEGPHRAALHNVHVNQFVDPLDEDDSTDAPGDGEPCLTPEDTLEHALQQFEACALSRIMVVDGNDTTRVIGHADRIRALAVYNQALVEAHLEEHR